MIDITALVPPRKTHCQPNYKDEVEKDYSADY